MNLLYTGVAHLYNPDNISYLEFIGVNNIRVYFNGGHCLPLCHSVADKVIKDLLEKVPCNYIRELFDNGYITLDQVPDILREGFVADEFI